ncbi:SpoIIE family protein phosphatase [Streptomyces sp. J2-1]|uniref:SpoIIE family protein phosphatase n=1 Tax=Streptomyces corallincola TaxID=2851888 RepID=UPI001C3810C7|nr:SpoIIE family protein phosphatase [Streptomyces corallincola]MBV2357199.1 SpoIIE family protein phosphatase [Streptomyces corallincola]
MSRVYPFDDAPTGRAVIADDGTLVGWSEGARRLLGHSADAVVGRPAAELLAGPVPPVEPTARRWDGTVELRHRDGRTLPVWLLAHHRPAADGRPGDWLVVTPLSPAAAPLPAPPDDPLDRAELIQVPCAVSIYDDTLRLRRMNDAMCEVVGLPEHRVRGLRPSEIGGKPQSEDMERALLQVLSSGRPLDVQTYMRTGGGDRPRAWLARMVPVTDDTGRVRGVCLAAHDVTDNYRARERLQLVNEASVRIGSTLDVTRTAQELADVCVPALADFVTIDLLDPPAHGGEPPARITAPVTLRRTAQRSVLDGVPESVLKPGQTEVYPPGSPQCDSLTAGRTIIASATGGDMRPWLSWNAARGERVRRYGMHSSMAVPIRARGLTLGVAVFTRHRRPDPFTADDRLLAEEITTRAAVCVDNARRYSRERETALALQRSLLPRTLPQTAALEASFRYLPAARAGVGGDWFDVIQLSGARVAMVVGDVVGHGVQASATMGRLRTAVRTLADIDLAPDELLTHLDDLVVRLSAEHGVDGSPGEVGATCLYAVYDPVSRRCTMARAGHPPPVLREPGEPPRQVELPAGPPLGVGGLPFESAEVELPEGTVLALYTDGLVVSREPDAEQGAQRLFPALSAYADSLDETCDRILHSLLPPGGTADDVALLLARTRALPASQVATWDVPADPARVANVRKQVVERLEEWSLEEMTFTAELVVSELVTNAIRYGARPIRLRLIQDADTLIVEVSDTSHTAPHLRRAKTFDEGGRGLLLVAQLTQRWGSRHTPEGKTIWAELGPQDEGLAFGGDVF